MPTDPDASSLPMKWDIALRSEPRHVRITLSGTLRAAPLRNVWEDIFSGGFWRKDAPLVFDLSAVELAGVAFNEVELIVEMLNDIRGEFPGGRFLIIVRSSVQFGKTRQYQTLAGLRKYRRVDVFKTETEAIESLIADHP